MTFVNCRSGDSLVQEVCRLEITKFILPKTHLAVIEVTYRYSGSKVVH